MPVMYRKAKELEEADEDGVDQSGPFPCLWQVPHTPPMAARLLHSEGTALGQLCRCSEWGILHCLHPQHSLLPPEQQPPTPCQQPPKKLL